MTEHTPLEILEADGASRLHISIVAEDGYLFAQVPLSYYQSGLDNLERIDHSANVLDKEKAEFIVRACNAHKGLVEAVEDVLDFFSGDPNFEDMMDGEDHDDGELGAMLRGLVFIKNKAKAEEVGS